MPFVKLDTKILDSTLWIERECREIFITALLMAEPTEIKKPLQAIKVNAIKPLGFEVPPGWYGFVHAAGPGIIRRAMVADDVGLIALEKLASPDPGSRSPDHEGRRMVRVDGGYIILNFMKYRDRDYTAAERQRRLRERKKLVNITRDSNAVTRYSNVTSRIAEADSRVQNTEESKSKALAQLALSDCEQIYDLYPRKVGRKIAIKSIKTAIDRLIGGEAKLPMTREQAISGLMERTAKFAASPAGQNGKFTPHPATWYNRSSYLDEAKEWQNEEPTKQDTLARRNRETIARVFGKLPDKNLSPVFKDTLRRGSSDLEGISSSPLLKGN
jgi:hypothetical protein